jgi:hypothetical protein
MKIATDREVNVQTVMERMGLDEIEAAFVVALARGECARGESARGESTGDVESLPPMTLEERRRIGLGIVAGGPHDPDLQRDKSTRAETNS